MISPGRLLYLLRRDFNRGLLASWHYYQTAPRIESYRRPLYSTTGTVPIHLLTGNDDWRLALWMLASFHYFSEKNWPIIVHDDGTLPALAIDCFQAAFPGLQVILRAEADRLMEPKLQAYPQCLAYRRSHPLALKIFDMTALEEKERLVIFDSDVLFFSRPGSILDWVESGRDECLFLKDIAEASNVTSQQAQSRLGVNLWKQVNSGLCLLPRNAIDLQFCEQCLTETSLLSGHIWRVEQTLFALCGSRYKKIGWLPDDYEISLRKTKAPHSVARHYVGAVRSRFYSEGLSRLRRLILPN